LVAASSTVPIRETTVKKTSQLPFESARWAATGRERRTIGHVQRRMVRGLLRTSKRRLCAGESAVYAR